MIRKMMQGSRIIPVGLCVVSLFLALGGPAKAQAPEAAVAIPEVMAEVNGDKIMKSDLAEECLRLHGESELGDQVKKFLIMLQCKEQQIVVTNQEINDEIVRMAKTFNMTSEEWLNLLAKERNFTADQYKQDIIWPILAIGKLAGARLTISEEEIQREYDAQFGPAVQVRQIVTKTRADAERILTEAKANPEAFPSLAKNNSLDPASQPYGGLIHPIRRGVVNPSVEQAVFALQPGEISSIVEWPKEVFLIFRCEQHLQPQNVDRQRVREQLVMKIRDSKTRIVSEEVFAELQKQARIDIVFGNPVRMQQSPGIAAVVNGQAIGMNHLAEVCLSRYGKDVLGDMISRLLIEQACRKQNIVITGADIDNEIREMAIKHVPLQKDGQPNIALWLKLATQESRLSPEAYRTNTIWPVLALKRLARPLFQVTEEDLERGFVATFGKKARCLAIAFGLNDQRRAQEVWAMANQRRTPEYFGDLAEKYSSDSDSRTARGVIAPIGRYCGQPALERELFDEKGQTRLLPNEISQLVQVDDHWVILYCLGYEEPTITDINDVKADILADIFDKKQKIAVARCYENLYNQAAIDNYLTGESRNPQIDQAVRESGASVK